MFPPKTPFFTKDIFRNEPFEIGDFTYGQPKVFRWKDNTNLKIGKFCSIGNNVTILLGGNHRTDWISTYPFNEITDDFPNGKGITGHPVSKGDVVIGNDVWIGYGSLILSGVAIGDGAVIAAGSVVTKNIGPYEIWGGNPAKFIKKRFSDQEIGTLLTIKWWDWNKEKINRNARILCEGDIAALEQACKV